MFVIKPILKAVDSVKYATNSNRLMRDLLALKNYYDDEIPKHDISEFPEALESSEKRKHSFKMVDDENKNQPPVKFRITIRNVTKPTETVPAA